MKAGLAILALAGAALASPFPQGSSSSGCQSTVAGTFEITVVNVTMSSKRSLESRQKSGTLMLTLNNGMLMDQAGRTGYIAANDQFQFDNPVQAGALTTSGWSVCSNGSLALKGNCIFYQCLSGSFYNLYDKSQGGQCAAIYIETMMMGAAASSGAASSGASVSQVSDGQPQATTKVTQISDGQIQATTMMITQISDGQIQAPTGKPVSQISDGQPQAPTGRPVSQISDGQIQATTAKPPVPPMTGAPVSQISDGQIQATTAKPAVSQISDGQIQATTGAAVSQISDGQIQATTGTSAAPAKYTGAANKEIAGSFALFAGVAGALALL